MPDQKFRALERSDVDAFARENARQQPLQDRVVAQILKPSTCGSRQNV